ncbi:MAG TPA: hypothetical protein VFR00_05720 [Hyphomicrobiaceae bacterium]|jgi:hypothetical protein|nr:hypothetical protein [Hyphomicrobiaceae bacterium]
MQRASFGELLDALARADPDGGKPPAAARHRHAFVVETSGPAADRTPPDSQRLLESLYGSETVPEASEADALVALHSWVVDELQLTADMTAGELQAVRRRFARAHHPDRAPAAERALASRRMMIANTLIDAALARRAS